MLLLPEDCETCHPIGAVHICINAGAGPAGLTVDEVLRDLREVGADDPEMVATARYCTRADVQALLDELVRTGEAVTWEVDGQARYRVHPVWWESEASA